MQPNAPYSGSFADRQNVNAIREAMRQNGPFHPPAAAGKLNARQRLNDTQPLSIRTRISVWSHMSKPQKKHQGKPTTGTARERFVQKLREQYPHIFTGDLDDGSYFRYIWQRGYDSGYRRGQLSKLR